MTDTLIHPTPQSSDPDRVIPTRRISFEASLADLPKHFAADENLIHSHLVAVLSGLFPDGEDFFVRSVRHYRDQITDPDLKRQVNGFIGQEATHGREHRVLNDRLAELGYPTHRIQRMTKKGLAAQERRMPAIESLAWTAALEHFTAAIAEVVLGDPEFQATMGHEAIRNILVWHALEESEHKAVAFDVYRAVGGSERTRIFTMKAIRPGFILVASIGVLLSLVRDPATYRRGNLRKSWAGFRASPLARRSLWDQLCEYDRRDFHPNDTDTSALEEHCRAQLFGDGGMLVSALSTS